MTQKICTRRSVFETNSSSSHSFVCDTDDDIINTFHPDILKAGVFYPKERHYGWEWFQYHTLEEKIQYLVNSIYVPYSEDSNDTTINEEKRNSPLLKNLINLVLEKTGVEIILKENFRFGGVDHESSDLGPRILENPNILENILFQKNSYIQTGNDNGTEFFIQTDLGTLNSPVTHLIKDLNKDEKYFSFIIEETKSFTERKTKTNYCINTTTYSTEKNQYLYQDFAYLKEDLKEIKEILEKNAIITEEKTNDTIYDFSEIYKTALDFSLSILPDIKIEKSPKNSKNQNSKEETRTLTLKIPEKYKTTLQHYLKEKSIQTQNS